MKWLTSAQPTAVAETSNTDASQTGVVGEEAKTVTSEAPASGNTDAVSEADKSVKTEQASTLAGETATKGNTSATGNAETTEKTKPPVTRKDPDHSMKWPSGDILHLLQLAAINVLGYLAYNGTLSRLLRSLDGHHVDTVNQHYLSDARQYVSDLLDVLTSSKMVLSVLQSSQGGIDFFVDVQIQLGQSLSALTDTVNYAWKLSLAALSSIELLSLSLETSHYSMTPALTLFFILLGIFIAVRNRFPKTGGIFSRLASSVAFLVLLTHFLIPWSVYATAVISHDVLSEHRSGVYQGFSDFQSRLPQHDTSAGLKDQVRGSISHFKDHQGGLHKRTSGLTHLAAHHTILCLTEYLLFPLLFLYALSKLVLRGLAYLNGPTKMATDMSR